MKERIDSKLGGEVDPTDEIRLSDDQVTTIDALVIVHGFISYYIILMPSALLLGKQLYQGRGRDRHSPRKRG